MLLAKCRTYEQYRASGREQQKHGVFPAVVWLISSPSRRAGLKQGIRNDQALDDALFTVIDPDALLEYIMTS